LKYYDIISLADFNEIKEAPQLHPVNKTYRIAGLVIDAQHRITKTGKNFGSLTIEDFSGKTELMLWSDDYVKFKNYLDKGKNILVHGHFKQRFNNELFEFKVTGINLLEVAKQALTRQLELNVDAAFLTNNFISFFEKNIQSNPGKASIKFNIVSPAENLKISMHTPEKGFSMNDDMATFLLNHPDVEVNVSLVH